MGLLTGLTLLFAAAKLFGFIDWSWWLVLLPAFIGIGIAMFFLALAVILKARD
jgi:hypothetical protein